jgi:hypothetical protein
VFQLFLDVFGDYLPALQLQSAQARLPFLLCLTPLLLLVPLLSHYLLDSTPHPTLELLLVHSRAHSVVAGVLALARLRELLFLTISPNLFHQHAESHLVLEQGQLLCLLSVREVDLARRSPCFLPVVSPGLVVKGLRSVY